MKQIILKTGELLTIREAMKEDARYVLDCTEKASSETDFLTFAGNCNSLSKRKNSFWTTFVNLTTRYF